MIGDFEAALESNLVLALLGIDSRIQRFPMDDETWYRVRIGPFLDIQQANAAVAHAQEMGHADLKIVSE